MTQDTHDTRTLTARPRQFPVLLVAAWAGLAAAAVAASQTPAASGPRADFFEMKVRPIFAVNCYDCHVEDDKGGLHLDSREAILKGGKRGPAIVPGNPDESLLIQAVRHTHDKLKMPKDGQLTKEQVEALAEWVKDGAVWPEGPPAATLAPPAPYVIKPEQRAFWSIQPLSQPEPPQVRDSGWPRTDIDRYVLAKLEQQGLTPVRPADRRTLLRRVSLDLIGLPPTPEETEAFLKDDAPNAFDKVVERLLASPQYGEAWARLWLDVARFGEDDGRSLDPLGRGHNPYPNAYLYRDWVIKAFNEDWPYDLFVKAQLAGDLLDDKIRVRTLPALGFLGLGPWYYDNGSTEVTRADERHDRVDVVSRGFLGLTVGCARCHDHKFDPIPARDYYAMAGVFLNTVYQEYPQAPKAVVEEWKAADKRIERLEKLLAEFLETESRQLSQTLALEASRYMQAAYRVQGEPREEVRLVLEDQKLDYELFDRWLKFLVKPPRFYPYLTKWQELIKAGGSRPEAKKLADELQEVLLEVLFAFQDVKQENEIIYAKSLPGTKKKEPAKLPSDFVTNDDFCPGCGLEQKTLPIEKLSLYKDAFVRDLQQGFDPSQVDKKLLKPGLLAFEGWGLERQLDAERRRHIEGLRSQIAALRSAQPPQYAYAHGVRESENLQNLRLSRRGNPFNLGDEVPRGFLSVLAEGEPVVFTNGSGRLELAEAILKQPIATRVIVNRVWKRHFGTGIVDSPSNFGVSGERPTHPELLEHLAQFFVANGLSLKKLHREILRSASYQSSNDYSARAFEKDPGNRLYWRVDRRRLSAEEIRDSLLFVSGGLDARAGGPSAVLDPFRDRRTVYARISRYKLDEYLQLFDFPSPHLSSDKRFTTNVPLQRLFFMNSDFMQQQAERLALRVASEPGRPERVRKLYRLVFCRDASEAELRAGLEYLRAEPLRQYQERKALQLEEARNPRPAPRAPEPPVAKTDAKPGIRADGMMAGLVPGATKKEDEKKLLPVTPLGRYAKVLMSSSEFLFVN